MLALASFEIVAQPSLRYDQEGNEVVVTGERRERSSRDSVAQTEVITRQEILDSGSENLAEALENQAGVEIRAGIRGRFLQLQGLDPQYTLILVNGQRVVGRLDNATDLTRIKAEEIERIEIVKGASSALYGSDAIAGVINIITRTSRRPVEAEVITTFGTGRRANFGTGNETSTSAFVGINSDFASNNFTAGWHRSDGYDLTPITRTTRLTQQLGPAYLPLFDSDRIAALEGTTGPAYSDLNFGNTGQYRLTENLALNTNLTYRYLDESRVDVAPPRQIVDRYNKSHDFAGGLAPVYALSDGGSVRASYGYSRFFDEIKQDHRGTELGDSVSNQDERAHEFRSQLDYAFFHDHFTTVGADGIVEELISPRVRNNYAYRHRMAAFLQDEWSLSSARKMVLVPGVRVEQDSQFGSQTTPKLAFRVDPTSQLKLRASAGAGYRAPSFKDLYLTFQNPGVGYEVVGNTDLKPERSRNYNAGAEYEPMSWVYTSVNVFYNRITNLIDFVRLTQGSAELTKYQTTNIRQAYTRGAELMGDVQVLDGWTFGAGYTLTDTRDMDQGIPLEGRSKHRGTLRVGYQYKPLKLGFELRASVFGTQAYWYQKQAVYTLGNRGGITYNPNAALVALARGQEFLLFEKNPDFPRQGYILRNAYRNQLDLRVYSRTFENYELFAGVSNLLDVYDVARNPQRPRYYYFGLRAAYKAADPAQDRHLQPQFESSRPLDLIR
ncbi:MAG: TonB-dependent receptor [Leptospirales bacterium]|nr:TonB-dependent receptor [Leptospirales bacterium]